MKTQLSQFPATLHQPYSGVYQQQGRMITDADWNAAMQVGRNGLTAGMGDAIGSGTPEQGGIIAGDTDAGFQIVWGASYVDGIRAVLASRTGGAVFDITDQADFPGMIPAPASAHRLYLDVWDRSLTALEEPELLDAALHGADTSTRTRTMAQIKYCPQDFDPEDMTQNPPIGEGRLTLVLRSGTATPDECEPCLDEIELDARVGNNAFRLEIHGVDRNSAGAPTRLTLKWSRENGAETAMVGQEPLGFKASDWVYEFYNSAAELSLSESHAGFHHPDVISDGFVPASGALVEGFPDSPPAGFALVRRWDGYVVLERNGAVWEMASQTIDGDTVPFGVDHGQRLSTTLGAAQHGHVSEGATVFMSLDTMALTLELADHQHLAGDYWIGVVREALHSAGDVLRDDETPDGILHHYMCLADVAADGSLTLLDKGACKRFQFPLLTNIHAEDVCYENSVCEMPGVENVQEALDHLCQQKDLKFHNKHLHGWGIVCGLIVECCPETAGDDEDPSQCVTLSTGYAIDCEGCDIVLEEPMHIDLIERIGDHDAENPDNRILEDGQGTACLHIALNDGVPTVEIEPHEGDDAGFLDQLLDGTLLGDFIQHCVLDLIAALTKELSFIEEGQLPTDEDGKELVSEEKRKFISFWNLMAYSLFDANGPYVWTSRREHAILRELYDRLRELLGSKTFCGLFDENRFPEYRFPDSRIDTWFGRDQHTRLKADPSGDRVYTYGGANATVNVFSTRTGELVEVIQMPVPEGGEVTALTCNPDEKLLYVAASVNGADTVLGVAQVGEIHKFERPMQILCDITITDMSIQPEDPKLIYAVGLGRGLFFLRPDVLADVEKPVPEPKYAFNAVGQMAVDRASGRIFCPAAASTDSDGNPSPETEVYDRVVVCAMDDRDDGIASEIVLTNLADRLRQGSDDIAVRPGETSRVYLVVDGLESQGDKNLITFDVPRQGAEKARLVGELAVQNTEIALAFNRRAARLYASFADSFRLQSVEDDGITVEEMRIPVQVSPTDVDVGPKGDIYAVNFLSDTVSAIPPDEVTLSAGRLSDLADMRWRILLAFYALVGNLLQYLKDCFCHHLLIKCPECDGSEKIYLACVEIRADEAQDRSTVYNICNFGKRKYVQTFMAWNYWLSLVPIIPLMKQAIARMCCSVLPNFLDGFTDNVAPPPKAPEFGAASGVATRVKTRTARKAVTTYKRTDFAALRRRQTDRLGIYGDFASDMTVAARAQPFLKGNGLRKESLRGAGAGEAVRELKSAGVRNIEVRPYDPEIADRYALDFALTPGHIDTTSKIIVYERGGKTAFIAEDRTPAREPVKVDPQEERRVSELAGRIEQMKTERAALQTELDTLSDGLKTAAEMRRTLKIEVDSMRPLKELDGVPAAQLRKLQAAGIRTIGDLAAANTTHLRRAEVGADTDERKRMIALAKDRLK